jgi:hypothetical protein
MKNVSIKNISPDDIDKIEKYLTTISTYEKMNAFISSGVFDGHVVGPENLAAVCAFCSVRDSYPHDTKSLAALVYEELDFVCGQGGTFEYVDACKRAMSLWQQVNN